MKHAASKKFPCPRKYSRDGTHAARLLTLLGPKKLAALQKEFGGKRVWVPKKGSSLTCGTCRYRDRCIKTWRRDGCCVRCIAERLSMSPKSIYRVLGSR